MTEKTKKATFNLHPDTLAGLDRAMSEGAATSKNALVEEALRKELKEISRKNRKTRWEQAMNDPLFLKDISDTEQMFQSADAETLGRTE